VQFEAGVIDSDGHVIERRVDLERQGWRGGATDVIEMLLSWEDRDAWGPAIRAEVRDGAFDPEARLRDMEKEGIDVAVNYPTPLLGVSDFPDLDSSTGACRAYNDWFAERYHAAAPERLHAMALVPLTDPSKAAREATRAVRDLGAVGVMVQPYAGDVHLCDRQLDVLWGVVEELGVPIGVHGSRHTCAPHLRAESFRNQARFYAASHPFQQQMAMGDLSLGGVLERFPRLKVVFLEAGIGWMPAFIDRLDEAYESVREDWISDRDELSCRPSEYLLSGNCWFSCEPDEPNLAVMVDSLGEDQVIYASDYPHFDCDFPNSVAELVEDSGLSGSVLDKVLGGNARRLYGLEV
jgi:predicted TIM-barrel fold metal-dependent hydrolase